MQKIRRALHKDHLIVAHINLIVRVDNWIREVLSPPPHFATSSWISNWFEWSKAWQTSHGNMQKSNSIGHFCKKFILHKFDPFALHNSNISRFEHHIWVKYFSHWSQFPTLQSPRKCGIQTLIELNWNYPRTISITFYKSCTAPGNWWWTPRWSGQLL